MGTSIAVSFHLVGQMSHQIPPAIGVVGFRISPELRYPFTASAILPEFKRRGLMEANLPSTMWSRQCRPQVGNHHPHGAPEDSNLYNQRHTSPQSSRASAGAERYDSHGYEQRQHGDSPYTRDSRAFTDLSRSLNDRQACHPGWHSSHEISGTKRKRIPGSSRQVLGNLSNTPVTPQTGDTMHNFRQRHNGDYRTVQDYRQLTSNAFRWRDNSLLPENVIVDQDQERVPNYHPIPFLNFHAANCPPGHRVNEQPGRYHHKSFNQPSSSSSRDTSSVRLRPAGSSHQGVSSASSPDVSVKEDPEREWLQLINGHNEASFDTFTGLGYAEPFLTPPTTVDLPTNERVVGNPLQHELPPWDFSSDLPSFSLNDKFFPDTNQDLSCLNDLDFAALKSAKSYDFKPGLTNSFKPFDDSSLGYHGSPIANQVSSAYPPLDSEPVPDNTPNLPKTLGDATYNEFKFDPTLPEWNFNADDDDSDHILNTTPNVALDLWDQPDESYNPSRSTSNSSGAQPTPVLSASKRYNRDRVFGYGAHDDQKNQLLVQWKQEGLSYKEIKLRGGFQEAESTLRGRYRTLTKPKEARVRKPEWREQDIHNLIRAVNQFARGGSAQPQPPPSTREQQQNQKQRYSPYARPVPGPDLGKIPWKQVAEHMEELGSYRFGNATVKKKYLEIAGEGMV